MSFEKNFKLKHNPFRITPAVADDELIWAGFPDIKQKIERRIKRSVKIPNSSLVLNWGEYGSGKTHAARFFSKEKELNKLISDSSSKIPYPIVLVLPKGKEPVNDIFISIIDKIDIEAIRELFIEFNIETVINSITSNLMIRTVLKAVFSSNVDKSIIKKYLYGNTTQKEINELNETLGDSPILRKLKTDSDYILLLSGLFTCLTYQKKVYSSVIMWIDEFEDIAILSSSNIDKTNNFLREILDNTPNNLLIFLNLTQSALLGVSDLGDYVFESVKSRIKERNNFELPDKDKLKEYLAEILQICRTDEDKETNLYYPFSETLVDTVIQDLLNPSIRSFNEAFSLLLELAEMEDTSVPITETYYQTVKNEIIGWKNE